MLVRGGSLLNRKFQDRNRPFEVILQGGLGNQLFGWALGLSAKNNTGHDFKLNCSQLNQWGYQLHKFGIYAQHLEPSKKNPFNHKFYGKLVKKLQYNSFSIISNRVLVENSFNFNPRFLNPNPGTTMYGYFQSWKYFESCSDEIIQTLNQTKMQSNNFVKLAKEFSRFEFAAVHFRRGDYITNSSFHGLLPNSYFEAGRKEIQNVFGDIKFICFTDSKLLAKENLPWCNYFIGPEDLADAAETLMLMKKANAIIGSNSSFSWWAAYLISNYSSLKIFPSVWFKNSSYDIGDLLLPSWMKLDTKL